MNPFKVLFFCCLISLATSVKSQLVDFKSAEFVQGGVTLDYGVAGGLNCPQFSKAEINFDGIPDLYVFDKVGNKSMVFLNYGTENEPHYSYVPQLNKNFPDVEDFVLLRDYNKDGIMDLFAYSDSSADGILVYTGYVNAQNKLAFERFNFYGQNHNIIYFEQPGGATTNIYVSFEDYPSIDDIDGDGDLDILTFGIGGGYVYWYKNNSVELGFGTDSLKFTLEDNCWGRFYESGATPELTLSNDPDMCANGFVDDNPDFRHVGSTILNFDVDNDNDKEILLGDISFPNLVYGFNGGTSEEAWVIDQDPFYPSYNVSAEINIFPASFYLDVDNDGKKDLLAAPNQPQSAENYECVWYYKNVNSNEFPEFEFQKSTFLVDQMIDFGSGSDPTFVDFNQDGLMDILVGTNTFYVPFGDRDPRLVLILNIGTATEPKFEVVDMDFLGMSAYGAGASAYGFSPAFGDMDGDGDEDLIIGQYSGDLFYAENTAGAGNPMTFATPVNEYFEIDPGLESKPTIVDINRDGLLDLVVGERNGNIFPDESRCSTLNYYENHGTATNPQFTADPASIYTDTCFGEVLVSELGSSSSYSSPEFLDLADGYNLFVASESGWIRRYDNIEDNSTNAFNQVEARYGNVREGIRTNVSFADIDNDGWYNMIVGNFRGGLSLLTTNIEVGGIVQVANIEEQKSFNLFPNPAQSFIELDFSHDVSGSTISIYNQVGQLMHNIDLEEKQERIDLSNFSNGLYFCVWEQDGKTEVQKFTIVK